MIRIFFILIFITGTVNAQLSPKKLLLMGQEIVVPTVDILSVYSITSSSASYDAAVEDDGGSNVTDRGIVYSTSPGVDVNDTKLSEGVGLGVYSDNITGLSDNTTYYYRAYAENVAGVGYSDEYSFITGSANTIPTVSTDDITNIQPTSATGGGNVIANGGASVTVRGVCWVTSGTPTIANDTTQDGTGVGTFTSQMTGLTDGTTYNVRAYATNSVGTGYGETKQFTPQGTAPYVATNSATSITTTGAILQGEITDYGGYSLSEWGIQVSRYATFSSYTTHQSSTIESVTDLFEVDYNTATCINTEYYYRAYATNTKGTAYGKIKSFTTSNVSLTQYIFLTTHNNEALSDSLDAVDLAQSLYYGEPNRTGMGLWVESLTEGEYLRDNGGCYWYHFNESGPDELWTVVEVGATEIYIIHLNPTYPKGTIFTKTLYTP